MSAIVQQFEHSLALPFFGIGMKTDLFQSSGHCWAFQICWHIESSTLTASSFSILNSSVGIPLYILVLFVVMLPKAHLTSHSRMSGCKWVTTPPWLSWSLRPFLYSSVYSSHFFLLLNTRPPYLPEKPVCMQVKKQQLGLEMEQRTSSKWGKEYVKAVYCHPAYLTSMQSTSFEMQGWMNQKLESRLPEVSTDDTTLMIECEEKLKSLLMKVKKLA